MDATQGETSWERVGELAAQLFACAVDLERFVLDETRRLQALDDRLQAQAQSVHSGPHGDGDPASGPRRPRHPGSHDPVIAAVLAQFERLEAVSGPDGAES